MTLGLSLGCSLGIGNSILPDWSEITRLWTPADATTQLWYDETSWLRVNPVENLGNKSGDHSHLTGTYYGGMGWTGGGVNGLDTLYIQNGGGAEGQVQVTDISQTWIICYKSNTVDDSLDQVFGYGESSGFALETNYPESHRFRLPSGQYMPDLSPGHHYNDFVIVAIRFDRSTGMNGNVTQARINGCPVDPSGGWVANTAGIGVENGLLKIGPNMSLQFCEMICLSSVDELEVQTAEGYLGHKWALPLCSANPFSSGPPTVTTVGATRYLTDENGNYITDANGAQVVIQG